MKIDVIFNEMYVPIVNNANGKTYMSQHNMMGYIYMLNKFIVSIRDFRLLN